MASLEQAREAKTGLKALLRGLPGVNGVGIARSDDGWCVRVNLVRGSEPVAERVPDQYAGVPVCTQIVGLAKTH